MATADFQHLVVPGLLSAMLGLALAPVVFRFVVAIGWLDKPTFRKVHEGHVPLAGGLLVVLSSGAVIIGMHLWDPPSVHLWAGGLMLFAIAFIDDRFPIRARYRFTVQMLAGALVTTTAGWSLTSLGHSLGPFDLALGVVALPFTVLGMSALTNAVNMTDGIDGLAGGIVAIAMFWLLVGFATIAGEVAVPALAEQAIGTARALSALIGSTLVFLLFNQRTFLRAKAEVFLGDGGSMMLGFLIAALCVYVASGFGERGMPPSAVGWIVAVPLIDMFSCIVRRVIAGRTPMRPDRRHLHHLVMALGLSPGRTAFVLQMVCFVCGLIGYGGWRLGVPEWLLFWSLVLAYVTYFFGAIAIWKRLEPRADLVGMLPEDEVFASTIKQTSSGRGAGSLSDRLRRNPVPTDTRIGR